MNHADQIPKMSNIEQGRLNFEGFFTSAVRNSLFDIRYLKSDPAKSLILALMGLRPGLCCLALSALRP
jgi:hypothetical protein